MPSNPQPAWWCCTADYPNHDAQCASSQPPAVPLRGDEGSPWCEPCGSYHPYPKTIEHWRELQCKADRRDFAPSVDEGVPVPDYATEIAIGRDWTKYKESAKRIADRIADGDCLICQHWNADAVYAIAVELASHARTDLAPCSKCDQEMERVKACEHIAEGDEGWEQLAALCPSTMAVAALRRQIESLALASKEDEVAVVDNGNVLRRDGTVATKPYFVLLDCDPGFVAALIAYANEHESIGSDPAFVTQIREWAYDIERNPPPQGDPDAPRHRKDDPIHGTAC